MIYWEYSRLKILKKHQHKKTKTTQTKQTPREFRKNVNELNAPNDSGEKDKRRINK